MRTTFLLCFVMTSLLVSHVSAQSLNRPRWTIGATGGGGQTWDDEGSIVTGWLGGGYVDRRISDHLDLEVSADLSRHQRNAGPFSFQAEGYTTYVSAAVVRRFGASDANFFLLGGGTVGIHKGTAGIGGSPPRATASTNAGFIFGGGAAFRTSRNLEIGPVVRMTLMRASDDSDPFSSIMAGVRVGCGRDTSSPYMDSSRWSSD